MLVKFTDNLREIANSVNMEIYKYIINVKNINFKSTFKSSVNIH